MIDMDILTKSGTHTHVTKRFDKTFEDDDRAQRHRLRKVGDSVAIFAKDYPRTCSILYRQVQLMLLLMFTLIAGYLSCRMEKPAEIERNDKFLEDTWLMRTFTPNETVTAMTNLTMGCLKEFSSRDNYEIEDSKNELFFMEKINPWSESNMTAYDAFIYLSENGTFQGTSSLTNLLDAEVVGTNIETTNEINESYLSSLTEPTKELYEYMMKCDATTGKMMGIVASFGIRARQKMWDDLMGSGISGLSFNWIRCWNDQKAWSSKKEKHEASKAESQYEFYLNAWQNDQQSRYEKYVEELGCWKYDNDLDDDLGNSTIGTTSDVNMKGEQLTCIFEANERSVAEATGGQQCQHNMGSATWFWFTIMTTIGYGNFSVSTEEGRSFVWAFGWLSILAFGGVMLATSLTYTTIADDLSRRYRIKVMQSPLISTLSWLVIASLWIVLLAYNARTYWDLKSPGMDYTNADSYWFAYITLLTVGLGDYVLPPEGLYASDVFWWAFLILHGNIFIAAFLGKLRDLMIYYIPGPECDKLVYYLARTSILDGYNTPISKSLDALQQMVNDIDMHGKRAVRDMRNQQKYAFHTSFSGNLDARTVDGHTIREKRIDILMEKKKLLVRLLEDTQSELAILTGDYSDQIIADRLHSTPSLEFALTEDRITDATVVGQMKKMYSSFHPTNRKSPTKGRRTIVMESLEDCDREEKIFEDSLAKCKMYRESLEGLRDQRSSPRSRRSSHMESIDEASATLDESCVSLSE